jgi:hypothetical protein
MHKNAHNMQITSYNLSISFFVYDEVITVPAQPARDPFLTSVTMIVTSKYEAGFCGRVIWQKRLISWCR